MGDPVRLDQSYDFKELVERTEAPRHVHESHAVLNQTNLPRKEVVEIDGEICIAVPLLFGRQFNVESDGLALCLGSAFVGRLHDSGPSSRDHCEVVLGQLFGELNGSLIFWMARFDASGSEDRHGRAHFRERFEGIDEFCHNSENSPGILVGEADLFCAHRGENNPVVQPGTRM